MPTEPHRNYGRLIQRFGKLVRRGWTQKAWGDAADAYPILSFERMGSPDAPTVLLVGGIHGDEPAGVEAAVRWMETPQPEHDRFNWLVIPCANPTGWENNQRTNSCHQDLNRNFRSPGRCAECAALIRATQGRRFVFSVDFHEDGEAPGFYVCESKMKPPFGGKKLVAAVAPIMPIWRADILDGRPVVSEGCVHRFPVTEASLQRRRFWPLEFHLHRAHTDHTYCTETPTRFPMSLRVSAHHAALRAACTFAAAGPRVGNTGKGSP